VLTSAAAGHERQRRAWTSAVPGGAFVPLAATGVSLWLLSGMTQAQAVAGAIAGLADALAYVLARQPSASSWASR
jgi:hypothetical protein